MTDPSNEIARWLAHRSANPYTYLTTTGRRTGQPHRIEIWFGEQDGRMFLMAGGRDRSDWVKNLIANPHVTIELGDETRPGIAHVLQEGSADDLLARDLLVAKYATPADPLTDWKRRSLGVVITFPAGSPGGTPADPDAGQR